MREEASLARAVEIVQADLAERLDEEVVILRPDGTEVYRGKGVQDRVGVPHAALRGNVVVHNHPGGASFSRQDVRVLLEYKVAQMRVTTPNWVYSLDLPSGTEWEDVADLVSMLMNQVDSAHRERILRGALTIKDAEVLRWHEIWQGVVEIRGWRYQRVPTTKSSS